MIKKTLYFGNPCYLSLQNNQLVVKLPEVERNASLPENFKSQWVYGRDRIEILVLVLDHTQITITSGVLKALLNTNVASLLVIKSMPVGLLSPLYGNTVPK